MSSNYIDLKDISSFLLEVSEEISKKNINNFIKTSFKNSNISNLKKSKLFYSYLNFSNEYQILSYNSSKKEVTKIDMISQLLDEKLLNLVIYEDYFLLFKGKDFYFIQSITKELIEEDLEYYISKRFNFDIEKKYFLSKKDFSKNENFSKKTLLYLNENKNLTLFYLYTLSLLAIFIFSFFYMKDNKVNTKENSIVKIENKIRKDALVLKEQLHTKLVALFNNLTKNKITILKLEYNKNKVKLFLSSMEKKNLYIFFKKYKDIKINSINYNIKKSYYETNAIISF